MKKINLEELKKIQIEILDYVNKFCKENNIKYWIDCGTLLGAIRHKGYIPWDDDIDIGMLRDDYEKFQSLFNQTKSPYQFICAENSNDYYYAFGKVIDTKTVLYEPDEETGVKSGVYIDVFVYDNAPDDDELCQKMFDKRDYYDKFRVAQMYPELYDHSSFIKRVMRFFLKLYLKVLPRNFYTKKCIKNAKKYVNQETKRVGNFTSSARAVADKSVFASMILVPFENKEYPAPVGYDAWLKAFYGDYMKLPPKEKRVSLHKFKAYYIGDKDGEK